MTRAPQAGDRLDLAKLERIAKAATPGPWFHYRDQLRPGMLDNVINEVQARGAPCAIVKWSGFDDANRSERKHAANAAFIAASREAVPELITALRAARAENARLREALTEAQTRIADARHEIGCVLWADNTLRKMPGLRKSVDDFVRGMVIVADGLANGFPPINTCEACGQPINPGQHYTHDSEDGISLHAACVGLRDSECAREDTREEREAFDTTHIDAARSALSQGPKA